MYKIVGDSLTELEKYCVQEGYMGWDPFDGLNSRLFQALPFIPHNRLARLIWIQAFKRSPVNFRKITEVDKGYNSKGLGLFLSGYCRLYQTTLDNQYLSKINFFTEKLFELQNRSYSGACWGYNFDWQARAFFQPKNTPTVVASVYVASALLDAYDIVKDEKLLRVARSTGDFILKDLNRTYDGKQNFSFSYSPMDKSVVYNASLLGSRLLARLYHYTREDILVREAKSSVDFCVEHQNDDGSWGYGLLPFHQWVDNFHTGFNLECISDYMKFTEDRSYQASLDKGFYYYLHTFFTKEGIPKYYNNSVYPVDIHSPAQFVITLSKLGKFQEQKPVLDKVLKWVLENMQSDKGYFYYQKKKYFTIKIPYIRWTQAWMFYALSTYLNRTALEANQYM